MQITTTIINTHPKIIPDANVDELHALSKGIKKLNNITLKPILLRAIHGNKYSGSRLKKFGMTDSDECQRGGEKETINHQIYECNYTNLLWNLGSQLTGLKNSNIKMMLGASELHDKAMQTLHAELIRALLAIESNISQKRISFLQ